MQGLEETIMSKKLILEVLCCIVLIAVFAASPALFAGVIGACMVANAIWGSSIDTKGGEPRDGGGV